MTRILGIAPYEGLKRLMDTLALQYSGIQLTTFIGDYQEGLRVVKETDLTDYDVIISRGGTSDLIREVSPIPVLSIQLSYYDILNAIKLAQGYGGSFVIVGFPSTARMASMLCDILQYDIPIYTTENEKVVEAAVVRLQEQNISLVLGDNMITRHAQSHGLHSVLITSGSASISEAFQQAIEFTHYYQGIRQENACYRAASKLDHRRLVVMDAGGKVLFSNLPAGRKGAYFSILRKLAPTVFQDGRQQLLRRVNGQSVSVLGDRFSYGKEQLAVFELTELERSPHRFSAVQMRERDELSDAYVRLFYSSASTAGIRRQINTYRRAQVVVISGEKGVGKDALAHYLYATGNFSSSVLFMIDCYALASGGLENLLESSNSPLFRKGHVFLFQNYEVLSTAQRGQVLWLLQNAKIYSGNQVILTVREKAGMSGEIIREILERLPAVVLRLPPLRQRIHEIPSLVSLYLNELRTHDTLQIAGMEPEGLTYLQGFPWQGNLKQMCRILDTLTQITTSPYIRTEDVVEILKTEELPAKSIGGITINLNQTLDEIIADVIRVVLEQEGMTRTKAAEQLGICRATLWKYMKRYDNGHIKKAEISLLTGDYSENS